MCGDKERMAEVENIIGKQGLKLWKWRWVQLSKGKFQI